MQKYDHDALLGPSSKGRVGAGSVCELVTVDASVPSALEELLSLDDIPCGEAGERWAPGDEVGGKHRGSRCELRLRLRATRSSAATPLRRRRL